MKKCLFLLFCLSCALLPALLRAQDKKLITGNFSSSFAQFVQTIESGYNYHFYYDPAELDSFSVNAVANNFPLQRLLDSVFAHSTFHYAVDADGRVFISKRFNIVTTLPKGFYDIPQEAGDSTAEITFDIPEDSSEHQNLNINAENRLFEIGARSGALKGGKARLVGYVRDIKNGEAIVGATVYAGDVGVTTDQFGYYSLTLPRGRYILKVSSVGMKETKRQVMLNSDGKLDIELQDYIASLKMVVVTTQKASNTLSTQMGVNKLNIKAIRQVPVVFGETDILKVVLTLPGVTSVGEASAGFNVRGGSSDQNLILYNDATIYNPSHLFGFFSAFDANVVKGIELYKSAIPEKYGGRLSSVLDVSVRDGNAKKWTGSGGIGPLTGKFTLEGPIDKGKTTLLFGGRTTYSNWILRSLPNIAYNKSKASFYDLNMRIAHTIDPHNTIYLTGYLSNDDFKLNNDTTYKYSNRNANIKWKHNFNNQFYGVLTAGIDDYKYSVSSVFVPVNGYKLGFDIGQKYGRLDFNLNPNNRHAIDFGISSIYYQLHPGSFEPVGSASLIAKNIVAEERGLESAVYLGDQYAIDSNLSVNAGVRFSVFNYLGPHDVYGYAAGSPRTITTIKDTTSFASGVIKTYMAPEVRLALRYKFTPDASIKVSFNTMTQYIHMLSNTTAISPTDIWKLSDTYIRPQKGYQGSLGFYKNFRPNIETSLEIYYKRIQDYMDYKSGASLVLNHHIETEVFNTRGKAYGVELLIKKTTGRLNGWLSYAYSRTYLQQDDSLAGELINKGNYYPASFDKPHSVNFIGNYQISHRYSISMNVVYNTGRPITLPLAIFNTGGSTSLYYSDRNAYRIPDYFRTDFSINIDGNHKVNQKIHNSFSIGVYNLTARQNAYSVYFINEDGKIKGYRLSIFGTAIPFITYNFKF